MRAFEALSAAEIRAQVSALNLHFDGPGNVAVTVDRDLIVAVRSVYVSGVEIPGDGKAFLVDYTVAVLSQSEIVEEP